MSDALTLLRNSVKNKKDFHEEEDKIIFGDVYYPKNVKTTYLIYGTGKDGKPKDYYTLECLAFLIKNRDLQHPMYVKNAGTRSISVVSRPDRRELLSYLDGEVDTTSSIDKNAPLEIAMQRPLPYVRSSQQSSTQSSSNLKRPATHSTVDDSFDQLDNSLSSKVPKLDDQSSSNLSKDQSSGSSQNAQSAQLKEQFIDHITKKFDVNAAQSSRPITENIMPLSEALTKEKIASIKAKKKAQQRKQVSSGVDIDDDILNSSGTSSQNQSSASASMQSSSRDLNRSSQQSNKLTYDTFLNASTSLPSVSSAYGVTSGIDDSDAIMREILQRESICRNRFSVLQSTGKQFEKDINAFLQLIKAKEDGGSNVAPSELSSQIATTQLSTQVQSIQQQQQQAQQQKARSLGYNRFDQERYGAKDETGGFSIDTKLTYQPNGGTLSLTNTAPINNNNNDTNKLTQLIPQKTNVTNNGIDKSKSTTVSSTQQTHSSGSVRKTSNRPIIIIPATNTSLITMYNCLDILQDLKYVPAEEKKKSLQNQNAPKDTEIIMHRREDGHTMQFKVIDNVNKLNPQDWDRVVAVFAQGKQWQFKDWPFGYGNPSEIFSKVKGFHLKMSGIPSDPNISKWSVSIIELDQHKRHLDRARLLSFWDELMKFILKTKPFLCA